MTKLDWSKTRPGSDGYDAMLAREWRCGPAGAPFERPDGSEELQLLAEPSIYWARELSRAYLPQDESEASHLRLFIEARRAAAHIYFRDGWPAVRSRVPAIYKKASPHSDRHYPSAHYAVYFDYWAMTYARGDALNRTGSIPNHVAKYSAASERWMRAPATIEKPDGGGSRIALNRVTELQSWLDILYDKVQENVRP
jgi:hypothetical protein